MADISKQLDAFFLRHEEEMLEDLRRLIRIPSLRGKPSPGKPFGEEPARVLQEALSIARGYGFETHNFENYAGTVEFHGAQGGTGATPDAKPEAGQDVETALGILAHLDVMPEGVGWTYPPFDITCEGGRIYGRGTADDKGPAVAALYAMRAVKEICPELKKNVRLILGTDEESGSEDIAYYFKQQAPPPAVFTPDADFPVINVEKGRFMPTFGMQWEPSGPAANLPRVTKIHASERFNVVPHEATAVIEGLSLDTLKDVAEKIGRQTGVTFSVDEKSMRVTASGKSAHGSLPEDGNNALTALLALLAALPLGDTPSARAIRGLHEMFPHGDTKGEALGIACCDEVSGALSMNFSICDLDESGFTAGYDCRAPISADQPEIVRTVAKKLAAFGAAFSDEGAVPPHHTPADTPFVQTLLRVYHDYTGNDAKCLSTGGGTYVHEIDGGVAFGCAMPGVDNHMHGADEFAVWEDLVLSAKMFAQVIVDMCGGE